MKTYVVNKCGIFFVKIFLHYIDTTIFALGYLFCLTLYIRCAGVGTRDYLSGVLGLVQLIGTSVRCAGVGTVDWYTCQVCWGWYS